MIACGIIISGGIIANEDVGTGIGTSQSSYRNISAGKYDLIGLGGNSTSTQNYNPT